MVKMINHNPVLICLVHFFISLNVYAADVNGDNLTHDFSANSVNNTYRIYDEKQKFIIGKDNSIKAVASRNEITRISFEHEIVEINAIAGELEYSISGREIYLRVNSEKIVNFFVKLEDESISKFILVPENIPATQIFIKTDKIRPKLINQEHTYYNNSILPDLKRHISRIINITLKPAPYLGFDFIQQNEKLKSANKNFKLELVEVIKGQGLMAEKIYITNKSKIPQRIQLEELMANKIAAYLVKKILLPKERTLLVRVEIQR